MKGQRYTRGPHVRPEVHEGTPQRVRGVRGNSTATVSFAGGKKAWRQEAQQAADTGNANRKTGPVPPTGQ